MQAGVEDRPAEFRERESWGAAALFRNRLQAY